MTKVLVTGSAGFIGYHLALRLMAQGMQVTGIDALTETYNPELKKARLSRLMDQPGYSHVADRIEAPGVMQTVMADAQPDIVVHLAAEAGVRASVEFPRDFLNANVNGTFELLEAARAHPPKHLLLASTSSAYGANPEMPYIETARTDWPVSFYAATKKATEVFAHSHSHIYDLPITMFRFFTVYGPWGRPDMACYLFTDAIMNDRPIRIFNHGKMRRDFVYIDDLIEGIVRLFDAVPVRLGEGQEIAPGDSLSPVAPFRVVNIGKSAPDTLMEFVTAIEEATGREAEKIFEDLQQGDVIATWADAGLLQQLTGYKPATPVSEGVSAFVDWYRQYNGQHITAP